MVLFVICQRLLKDLSGFRKISSLVICPSKIGQHAFAKRVGRVIIRIELSGAAQVAHSGRRLTDMQSMTPLLNVLRNLQSGAA